MTNEFPCLFEREQSTVSIQIYILVGRSTVKVLAGRAIDPEFNPCANQGF